VRVIGPPRAVNQVEISATDALALGIEAPIRESADLDGTPGVIIEGPRACMRLDRGVIRALRHLHMSPSDADRFGLKDHDRAAVAAEYPDRRVLFHDVLVRVSPDYRLELHLNADDGSAADLRSGDHVVLRPHTSTGARGIAATAPLQLI
jgi:propanediol utilization protein